MDIRDFRKSLRKLERLIGEDLKRDARCCGVTSLQCHVLLEIAETNEIKLKDLAKRLDLDKGNVSRTIDTLVETNLIYRKTNPDRRREVIIGLTPPGAKKTVSIHSLCDRLYQELFRDWPELKKKQAFDGLQLIVEALQEMTRKGNCPVGSGGKS